MTCNNADIREHHCLNWSCTELPPLTLLSHHNLEIWSHWCLGSPPTDNNYMIVGGSQTFHNWRRVEIDKLTDPSYVVIVHDDKLHEIWKMAVIIHDLIVEDQWTGASDHYYLYCYWNDKQAYHKAVSFGAKEALSDHCGAKKLIGASLK